MPGQASLVLLICAATQLASAVTCIGSIPGTCSFFSQCTSSPFALARSSCVQEDALVCTQPQMLQGAFVKAASPCPGISLTYPGLPFSSHRTRCIVFFF